MDMRFRSLTVAARITRVARIAVAVRNTVAGRIATLLVLAGLCCTGPIGCAARIPREALALSGPSLEIRQRSTRRFETTDEPRILAASAALLQDLGFVLDGSESELGFIVASKDRTAVEAKQVFGKVMYAIFFRADVPIDRTQKFRASVVTRPVADHMIVRVTFQRIVWNDRGVISRLERIDEPEIYQEFFDKLSQAVFLDDHEI